jgi:hypothetical protein
LHVRRVTSVSDTQGIASVIDDEPAECRIQGLVGGRNGRGEQQSGGGTETK